MDRLADVQVQRAEALGPQAVDRAQQPQHGLALLRRARHLVEVRLALDQLFVADPDRHEHQRAGRVAQVAVQRHRQHSAARGQRAAGAAAPALDEVLDRVAAADHLVHVLAKHGCEHRLAPEAAPQEEGASAPQDRPDQRDVEVGARGHVRRRDPALQDHVGQNEVVDVAAMARHVDDARAGPGLRDGLEAMHVDAGVDATPEHVERALHGADHRVRVVGRDLVGETPRLELAVGDRPVDRGGVAASSLGALADRAAHGFALRHDVEQRVAVREVRPNRELAVVAKARAQQSRHAARGGVAAGLAPGRFVEHRAYRDRFAEAELRVAPVGQHPQELAQHARALPAVGQERRQDRVLAHRRAPPEHAHGHELHVERGVAPNRFHQALQAARIAVGVRAQRRGLAAAREEEERAALGERVGGERRRRKRQAERACCLVEHQERRELAHVQRVADRAGTVDFEARRVGRRDPIANDEPQQAAQCREQQAFGRGRDRHDRHRTVRRPSRAPRVRPRRAAA